MTSKPFAVAIVVALLLMACGGGDDQGILSGGSSDRQSSDAPASSQSAGQPSSSGTDPARVDVCALFDLDDASAVVAATRSGQPGGSVMTKSAMAVDTPLLGSCKFNWNGSPAGAIQVVAAPASALAIHRSVGTPVPGIGDEVIHERGTYYLRVGNIMLSIGENSFTSQWVLEMYKRMAPKMK
jgi:hypothetical protein